MVLTGFLASLFRRTGMWDFLKERTKSNKELKAEEARLRAIHQLIPELPDGATVVQVGPDGYFVISMPGAPALPIDLIRNSPPLRNDGIRPPEIEPKPHPPEIDY
jgi:hypothetical protein